MPLREKKIEYFAFSYFPDAITERHYNLALLIIDASDSETWNAVVRVNRNTEELKRIDPDADTKMLNALIRDMERQFLNRETGEQFLQQMMQSFSNIIRISVKQELSFVGDRKVQIDALCRRYFG